MGEGTHGRGWLQQGHPAEPSARSPAHRLPPRAAFVPPSSKQPALVAGMGTATKPSTCTQVPKNAAQQPQDASPGRGPMSVARFGRPLRAVPGLWPRSNPLLQVPVNAAEPAEFCESKEQRWLRSSPPKCYMTRGKSFAQQSLQDHSLSPGFALPAPSPPAAPSDPFGSLTAPDTRWVYGYMQ